MKTDEIAAKPPTPWVPESDLVRLALLGKLVEESGELLARIGRCIVQGVDGLDPITGQPQNVAHVAEELADVAAVSALLGKHLSLDVRSMEVRANKKRVYLSAWLEMLFKGRRS